MCIYVNTEYWPEYSSKKYLCGFPDFTSKSSEMTDRIHHAGIIPSTSLLLVTGSRNSILNLVLKNFAAVKTFLNIF